MEETKETRAARKEVSAMEEARAKCKKYSTETKVGKLLLAGLDPEVISSSGQDELINFTLTVEGFDVEVTLPKKKEKELDPMQMMMKMMMEENKRRDEENKRRDEENKRREEKRENVKKKNEKKKDFVKRKINVVTKKNERKRNVGKNNKRRICVVKNND